MRWGVWWRLRGTVAECLREERVSADAFVVVTNGGPVGQCPQLTVRSTLVPNLGSAGQEEGRQRSRTAGMLGNACRL
jgi:hypothetical protein